jgi:glycosyltransferase involved in cell wall biosynthesis
MRSTPVIDYWCHGYATGYGTSGQRLVRGLLELGATLRWTPIDFDPTSPRFADTRPSHPILDRHRSAVGPVDVVVLHATPEVIPAAEAANDGAALICHTVWETDRVPAHWPGLLNRCDGVIVPTEWNAEVFRAGGVTVPIGVVPHASEPTSTQGDTAWLDRFDDRFIVYTIADWSHRKAPWRTVETFARSFDPDDDGVALVVKTGREVGPDLAHGDAPPGHGSRTWWAMALTMREVGRAAEILLVDHHLTDPQVVGLHQRGDCWLSLPHGEGWDLGAFDAATHGTPVVTTGWGGPTSYLDPDASWLVPAAVVPVQLPDAPPDPSSRWAEPSIEHAVDALRQIRADPAGARARGRDQATRLRAEYAPPVVAQRFLSELDRTLGQSGA